MTDCVSRRRIVRSAARGREVETGARRPDDHSTGSVVRGQVIAFGRTRVLLRVEGAEEIVLGTAAACGPTQDCDVVGVGISPITTSRNDLFVGGPSPSTARPDSPAEIDPSRAAVRRSSSGESSSSAAPTSVEREVGAALLGASAFWSSNAELMERALPKGPHLTHRKEPRVTVGAPPRGDEDA